MLLESLCIIMKRLFIHVSSFAIECKCEIVFKQNDLLEHQRFHKRAHTLHGQN